MAFRLQAVRAELGRVHDFTVSGSGNPFELPESIGELREAVDSLPDCRAVLIDPLAAAVSVALTSPTAARRKIMAPLQGWHARPERP